MTDVSMDIAKFLNAIETSPLLSWMTMASDGAGNNIFVNDWPDEEGSPDEAALLVKYAGGPPTETFSNPLMTRHPRVQLTIRGMRSEVNLDRSDACVKALSVVKDQVINGTRYQRIKAVGEPFEIGPDSKNREQAVTNFEVDFYDTP